MTAQPLKLMSALSVALISSSLVGAAYSHPAEGADRCPKRLTTANYGDPVPLYRHDTPEFTPVKRWDKLVETIDVLPSDALVLTRDMIFDGRVKGTVKAGTSFEASASVEHLLCASAPDPRQPYLCFEDANRDGQYEKAWVTGGPDTYTNGDPYDVTEPGLLISHREAIKRAKTIGELPNTTIVFGRGIVVRKASKKEVRISVGNALNLTYPMAEKEKKRCGEICMSFDGDFAETTVKFRETEQIEFAGTVVKFKVGDNGEPLVAVIGELPSFPIEVSCNGAKFKAGGVEMVRGF